MIVAAWFLFIGFVILLGFAVIGVTFWHWFKQSRWAKKKPISS